MHSKLIEELWIISDAYPKSRTGPWSRHREQKNCGRFARKSIRPMANNTLQHLDSIAAIAKKVEWSEQSYEAEANYHLFMWPSVGKTVNIRNISGMLLCCKKKANQAWENWIASKNVN